jgi:small-conductance mechanosensitive channel
MPTSLAPPQGDASARARQPPERDLVGDVRRAEMQHLGDFQSLVLFAVGRTPVTLGGVIAGATVTLFFFLAARLAGVVTRRLRERSRHGREALFIVQKLVTYGLAILGVIAGLTTTGLNLSSLAVFAGAIGVGVGLGLQGIVKEFVSGLVLIFDRVLNVGDFIEVAETRGVVQEIGPRAVRIRTNDRVDLIVPNSKFIDGPVVNWTLHGEGRRIHVPFSVASDADRTAVREVVLQAARSVPFTLPETDDHKSQVWLTGFGDNGLNFELLVWPTLEAVKRPGAMLAAYNWAIADALDQAGIEIPYPQMEVRIRSLFGQEGRDALAALKLEAPAAASARAADPQPSHNDAAAELARPMAGPEPAADD